MAKGKKIAHIFYKYSCHMRFIIIVIVQTSVRELHHIQRLLRIFKNDTLALLYSARLCIVITTEMINIYWNCKSSAFEKFYNNDSANVSIFYYSIFFPYATTAPSFFFLLFYHHNVIVVSRIRMYAQ